MYYIEVIHIPSVVPYLESSFYHVVKLVQIDIAEELTGEVADRQSDALWLSKQALGRWQQHPFLLVAHHLAVQCVVFEDDAFYKEENKLRILSRDVTVLAFLFPLLHEFVVNNTVEDVLVDAHEIINELMSRIPATIPSKTLVQIRIENKDKNETQDYTREVK